MSDETYAGLVGMSIFYALLLWLGGPAADLSEWYKLFLIVTGPVLSSMAVFSKIRHKEINFGFLILTALAVLAVAALAGRIGPIL